MHAIKLEFFKLTDELVAVRGPASKYFERVLCPILLIRVLLMSGGT